MGVKNNEIAFEKTILFEIKSVIFFKINDKMIILKYKNDNAKEKSRTMQENESPKSLILQGFTRIVRESVSVGVQNRQRF